MKIACIVTRLFEDQEYAQPKKALEEAGHQVIVIAPKKEEISGYRADVTARPDLGIADAKATDYDALFVPGGFSPDQLRADDRFLEFAKAFRDKPIFAICHGPQLLFTAGLLDGRRVTAWKTVQGDLRRGGIDVVNEQVVIDGNLVTSRQPSDLAAFSKAIVGHLSRGVVAAAAKPATVTEGAKVH